MGVRIRRIPHPTPFTNVPESMFARMPTKPHPTDVRNPRPEHPVILPLPPHPQPPKYASARRCIVKFIKSQNNVKNVT